MPDLFAIRIKIHLQLKFLASTFLDPIIHDEISSIVKNLKTDVAPGIDGIQNYTLKIIRPITFIGKPMTYIFNLCFTQGIFPSDLKNGIIVPIHNYRLITLLPAFSKIFEKCINHRLLKHLRINNIISKNQFGFKKNYLLMTPFFPLLVK